MSKCCRLCCKEFKGWCKAFTRTELVLTVVEAVLLVGFIAFLVFLVLHLLACHPARVAHERFTHTAQPPHNATVPWTTDHYTEITPLSDNTDTLPKRTDAQGMHTHRQKVIGAMDPDHYDNTDTEMNSTVSTRCTATGLYGHLKTLSTKSTRCTATGHGKEYHTHDATGQGEVTPEHISTEENDTHIPTEAGDLTPNLSSTENDNTHSPTGQGDITADADHSSTEGDHTHSSTGWDDTESDHGLGDDATETEVPGTTDVLEPEMTDGELADDDEKNVVIALVKIKPSGVTFGCILTVISNHWVITAASCIDSIEEVDSLDAFVIMENYGEVRTGKAHVVADVKVHPLYAGGNKSHDVALLRTEYALGRQPVALPTLADYFKITMGEKMDILGFGNFRSIDTSPLGRRVRAVAVHLLPLAQCAGAGGAEGEAGGAPRHLRVLSPVHHARCAAGPLCTGVLFARGSPCNYCAGAPLLRARRLFGVMADNEACGAACEPALYANLAALRPWINSVININN